MWVEVQQGYRLPSPEGCPADIFALMMSMWAASADARPDMRHAANRLAVILKTEKSESSSAWATSSVSSSQASRAAFLKGRGPRREANPYASDSGGWRTAHDGGVQVPERGQAGRQSYYEYDNPETLMQSEGIGFDSPAGRPG